jgi:hypothetical protein
MKRRSLLHFVEKPLLMSCFNSGFEKAEWPVYLIFGFSLTK